MPTNGTYHSHVCILFFFVTSAIHYSDGTKVGQRERERERGKDSLRSLANHL